MGGARLMLNKVARRISPIFLFLSLSASLVASQDTGLPPLGRDAIENVGQVISKYDNFTDKTKIELALQVKGGTFFIAICVFNGQIVPANAKVVLGVAAVGDEYRFETNNKIILLADNQRQVYDPQRYHSMSYGRVLELLLINREFSADELLRLANVQKLQGRAGSYDEFEISPAQRQMLREFVRRMKSPVGAGDSSTQPPSNAEMRLAAADELKNSARYAEAAEQYEKQIRANANDAYAHYQLSWSYLYLGLGEKAARESQIYLKLKGCRDLTEQPDLTPYARFVSYFGYRQAGLDFDARRILEEGVACAEKSTWTYSVLRYLLRELSAKELLAQATEKEQMLEAHAYIGMDLSLGKRRDEALPYLKWVTLNGTRDSAEYFLALTEIQRIEAAK
jgi:hypothetical protein